MRQKRSLFSVCRCRLGSRKHYRLGCEIEYVSVQMSRTDVIQSLERDRVSKKSIWWDCVTDILLILLPLKNARSYDLIG